VTDMGAMRSLSDRPTGLAFTPDCLSMLVADMYAHKIRVVDFATRKVSTLATGFNYPSGVVATPDGAAIVMDFGSHTIQLLNIATGNRQTLAGSGSRGWQDGIGTNAMFNNPNHGALTPDGRKLLVTEDGNRRIHLVNLL
jgi:DNA-binding beta-propeller fold protein YncE